MKLYVAGKTHDIRRVRHVQQYAVVYGHKITHDWTQTVEANGGPATEGVIPDAVQQECAIADAKGVRKADVLIALGHHDVMGTIWECGMAAAWGMPIWLVEWEPVRHTVFVHLPQVEKMSILDCFARLRDQSPPWVKRQMQDERRGPQGQAQPR